MEIYIVQAHLLTLYQNKWPRQSFFILHNFKATFVRRYVPVWTLSVAFN